MTHRPASDAELRGALYAGTVFLLAPTAASLALVDLATGLRQAELGPEPRRAHERFPDEELFARVGRLRHALYTESRAHELLAAMAASVGFPREVTAFDPPRLRAIVHGAASNPRAAPVYYPHRDTWYAHPRATVTMWTALEDLAPEETFVFHPERFAAPVPNDSEVFDYDAWVKNGYSLKIGWQDRDASLRARYPTVLDRDVDAAMYGPARGFSCCRGAILLFSGAHFHRTLPQSRGLSRFSLDARLVHLGDHARGLGAPDVDNRSRGSALGEYVQPADVPRAAAP